MIRWFRYVVFFVELGSLRRRSVVDLEYAPLTKDIGVRQCWAAWHRAARNIHVSWMDVAMVDVTVYRVWIPDSAGFKT